MGWRHTARDGPHTIQTGEGLLSPVSRTRSTYDPHQEDEVLERLNEQDGPAASFSRS